MPKAIWNGTVIAESDDTVVVEGNHYFPADSVAPGVVLTQTTTQTRCPWKGDASTTRFRSTAKITRMRRGSTRIRRARLPKSKTGSPSGVACASRPEPDQIAGMTCSAKSSRPVVS